MADIKNELNQIKNAVKGVEVRGSIHDGIDKINKESEESKSKANEAHDVMESIMSEGFDEAALNANFEQKLDNKIANLQPEWTQFKENTETQLADVANEVEENNESTISELNKKRDRVTPIGMQDFSQEVREALVNGGENIPVVGVKAVDTLNLKPKSVTEEETTFIDVSSNIFNKNSVLNRKTINDNGEIVDSSALIVSEPIPVIPGESISWNGDDNQDHIRVFYDDSLNFVSIHKQRIETFNAPENAYYLRVVVYSSKADTLQINRGSSLLPYEPYKRQLNEELIKENSITTSKTTDLGTFGMLTLGNPFIRPNINLLSRKVEFTKGFNIVYKNKRYNFGGSGTVELSLDSNASYQYIYFDTDNKTLKLFGGGSENHISVRENYVLIMLLQFKNNAENLFSVFCTCDVTVNGLRYEKYLESVYGDGGSSASPKLKLTIPDTFYKTTNKPNAQGTGDADFDYGTTKAQDVYDKFEELRTEFPNYITRTFLGNDQSDTLPIYRYDFTPPQSNFSGAALSLKKLPKILLTCGVHGNSDETVGDLTTGDPHMHIFSLYYFFEDLCRRWQDNEAMEFLRWNVRFSIIPIANPWGMNNNSRANSRVVDINRNMSYSWNLETNSHKGSAPFSEKESQYIRDFVQSQSNDNVVFHMDYHCVGGNEFVYNDKLIRHLVVEDSPMVDIADETIRYLSRNWIKNGIDFGDDENSSLYAKYGLIEVFPPRPQVYQWVAKEVGIPSMTIEAFRQTRTQSQNGLGQFNSEAVEMNVENLANWILIALRNFTE